MQGETQISLRPLVSIPSPINKTRAPRCRCATLGRHAVLWRGNARQRVGVSSHVAKGDFVLAAHLLDNGMEVRVMAVVDSAEEMVLNLVVETAAEHEAPGPVPSSTFPPRSLGWS